jgi:dolichol-phosphate mannosyltransferase
MSHGIESRDPIPSLIENDQEQNVTDQAQTIAVVIPSYKVRQHILGVLARIGPEVSSIYVVDDGCPDGSGAYVKSNSTDQRIRVIRHPENQGVGGAVMTGYKAAIADGIDIIVKVDGDGQMDPALIPDIVAPIVAGEADYTKGNRFFDLEDVRTMPGMRLFGNTVLSLMTKVSSGYWNLFDPTNGYTAIHSDVARHLPFGKINRRYFFETDMLFRLNTLRAVVVDVPMPAQYRDEVSAMNVSTVVGEFFYKHVRNFGKRIFYNYYLRDMSLPSFELPLGLAMLLFGMIFGGYKWLHFMSTGIPAPAGTVMLAALPVIVGLQLILAFLGYDASSVPNRPIHRLARNSRRKRTHQDHPAEYQGIKSSVP